VAYLHVRTSLLTSKTHEFHTLYPSGNDISVINSRTTRLAEHKTHARNIDTSKVLVGNSQEKGHSLDEDITMDVTDYGGNVFQDRVQ
jgi:hypothetical protein